MTRSVGSRCQMEMSLTSTSASGLVPRVVRGGTATVAGSNGLYRREVFDLVDFDPALREGEDSALNHAMERQGLSSVTVPGLLRQA